MTALLVAVLFAVLFGLIILGVPIGIALAGSSFVYIVLSGNAPEVVVIHRMINGVDSFPLLAVPFFTFMGANLERSGLAEDMLEGAGQLFGPLPGGIAYAVILVGAVMAAITGTVAASVIAMAVVSLPVMLRYGYDMRLATGVIAAAGTTAQLIPPSLVLIILADQLGRSVADLAQMSADLQTRVNQFRY